MKYVIIFIQLLICSCSHYSSIGVGPEGEFIQNTISHIELKDGSSILGYIEQKQDSIMCLRTFDFKLAYKYIQEESENFKYKEILLNSECDSIKINKIVILEQLTKKDYKKYNIEWFFIGQNVSIKCINGIQYQGRITNHSAKALHLRCDYGRDVEVRWSKILCVTMSRIGFGKVLKKVGCWALGIIGVLALYLLANPLDIVIIN